MSSFESFLQAMSQGPTQDHVQDNIQDLLAGGYEEYGHESYSENPFNSDNLGTAKPHSSDKKFNIDELDFMKEADVKEEEGHEEEQEEQEEQELDASEYIFEDWDSTLKLPDGTEVNGHVLKDFQKYGEDKVAFQEEKTKYHQREQMLVENADIGMKAINMMKEQLLQSAHNGSITQAQLAQAQVLDFMENQFNNFSSNLKSSYSMEVQQQEAHKEQMLNANIDACFEQYKDFANEVPVLREYIHSKGFNADEFLKEIGYNPKVISMLMDASVGMRANKKVGKAPSVGIVKSVRTSSENKKTTKAVNYEGISSYDIASYSAFSELGI